jgi:hypothetical protein
MTSKPSRGLFFLLRIAAVLLVCLSADMQLSAAMRIQGRLLEAGTSEPIDGAILTCEGHAELTCGSDWDGHFATNWFGDTLCGLKVKVFSLLHKPTFFFIPWLKDDPQGYSTIFITLHLQRDPLVMGTDYHPWSHANAQKFRKKDSTTVSVQVWCSDLPSLKSVSLAGSTGDTLYLFQPQNDSVFSARVPSRNLHLMAWQAVSRVPGGAPAIQVIRLKNIAYSPHLDWVVDPPAPVKPTDWVPCSYPPPPTYDPINGIPPPESIPITYEEKGKRAEWPGGEAAFMESLHERCGDIRFKTSDQWMMLLRITREGQMKVVLPREDVKDTSAWGAVRNILENEMPRWTPALDQGRKQIDFCLLMIDTKAFAASAKALRKHRSP